MQMYCNAIMVCYWCDSRNGGTRRNLTCITAANKNSTKQYKINNNNNNTTTILTIQTRVHSDFGSSAQIDGAPGRPRKATALRSRRPGAAL